jgi:MADS-box transcription factor
MPDPVTSSSGQNKRQRPDPRNDGLPPVGDNAFIQDNDAVDSGGDEDEEEEGRPKDKKAGRRKIKIEFIQDKSRRHITFSKRKAGIMKKVRSANLVSSCALTRRTRFIRLMNFQR